MTALPPPIAEKCAKALGQLASPHEGQVMAGARGLLRILEGAGLGITDLSSHIVAQPREVVVFREPPPRSKPDSYPFSAWREAFGRPGPNHHHGERVARCERADRGRLNEWERGFLASLASQLARSRAPSAKQLDILDAISVKLGVATA